MNVDGARPREAWVLYDGLCGLCDASVGFLMARDRRRRLRFAPLQGATAAAVRERHPDLPPLDESFILVEYPGDTDERVRVRSDAALAALDWLGGVWRVAAILRVVPRPLRDAVYRFIARNRLRWFGRLDSCRMPTPEDRERLLD